jgi:hypothetical protein
MKPLNEIRLDVALAKADAIAKADAGFEESKHPRAEDGKFGSGGASSGGSSTSRAASTSKGNAAERTASARTEISKRTGYQLEVILKNPNTDPKVKKLIEKELDERGGSGWSMDKARPYDFTKGDN